MATNNLKDMPEDVRKYVLKVQGEIKTKKVTQYSIPSTVFQIIREHEALTNLENLLRIKLGKYLSRGQTLEEAISIISKNIVI